MVKNASPKVLWTVTNKNTAHEIKDLIVYAADKGTGASASIPGIKVADKTGSTGNPQGQSHAWFIGFAPADNPLVAVAVIDENSDAGGREAAPIAREIMRTVIRQKR